MKTYKHIEDYIEVIAGVRDPVTNHLTLAFLATSPISLARYDVNIVNSFAEQCSDRIAFTDKQAELATKIVLKYERQLAKLGVDVTPANAPEYRIPLREVDRNRRIWREGDVIFARFPYVENWVDQFKETNKVGQGLVKWNKDLKVWQLALTEYNVNWVVAFGSKNDFEIDPSITDLMALILECEQTPYKIELRVNNDQLEVTNAAPELIQYIQDQLGGFGMDNLYTLIDHADILGYTIEEAIEEAAIAATSPRMYNLMINKDSKLGANDLERNFLDVLKYAEQTDRLPLHIYEPNLSNTLLDIARRHLPPEQITRDPEQLEGAKVFHFTKYQAKWEHPIPLLLSSAGMLYGGEKQLLIDRADKVVYLTTEVYNKASRGARSVAS